MERLKNKAEILFVTGTDTGVGKSVLSLLIMQYLFAKGHTPFYLKPFQTGCKDPYDKDSDARFIYSHVAQLQDKDPADSVVYCFTNPKAPLFAARDDAREIDLAVCDMIVTRKSGLHSHLVIEGAGGLLVPVNSRTTMADLILRTDARPIIAARAGLGTINHTLLTIEAIRARGVNPRGIVFLDTAQGGTSPEMIQENKSAIESLSGVKVAGTIGRIEDFATIPPGCFEPLHQIFGS